jgi:hypothetical protein
MGMAVGCEDVSTLDSCQQAAVLCSLLVAGLALAASEKSTPVAARLADDGRSFRVTAKG